MTINYILAIVFLFVAIMDIVIAKLVLLPQLAKKPNTSPGSIALLQRAIYIAAAFMLALSAFFFFVHPL